MFFGSSRIRATDERLMHFVKQGNDEAFEILYARYARQLLHYFYRMLNGNEALAQDFLQELFLKLIQRCDSFDESQSFKTWLYSIAYNMCKNEYRRQSVRKNYLQRANEPNDYNALASEESLDRQYFKKQLMSGLEQLSDEQRATFLLRFQEELTIPQISAIMNCPAGTVKSRLFYACNKLAELLKEFNPEGEG